MSAHLNGEAKILQGQIEALQLGNQAMQEEIERCHHRIKELLATTNKYLAEARAARALFLNERVTVLALQNLIAEWAVGRARNQLTGAEVAATAAGWDHIIPEEGEPFFVWESKDKDTTVEDRESKTWEELCENHSIAYEDDADDIQKAMDALGLSHQEWDVLPPIVQTVLVDLFTDDGDVPEEDEKTEQEAEAAARADGWEIVNTHDGNAFHRPEINGSEEKWDYSTTWTQLCIGQYIPFGPETKDGPSEETYTDAEMAEAEREALPYSFAAKAEDM